MTDFDSASNVLRLFATYGFRKASMSEIAAAAGVSRQSIYNLHGSKEAVLDWATEAMLAAVTDRAVACLSGEGGEPAEVLAAAFQAWIGDHVAVLRGTPHGGELLDNAIATAAKGARNYEQEFLDAVTDFLMDSEVYPSRDGAVDGAFVLHVASKGLLLKSDTGDDFSGGMQRVIAALLRKS